jgi:hypothetical protein
MPEKQARLDHRVDLMLSKRRQVGLEIEKSYLDYFLDKLPLKLPMTIQCRHSEMQTDSINSKDLNGHVLIFTDAKVEDDTIVKLEEKMANEFKAENSSSELDKSIPSASTRKQRRDKQDTEMSALKAKTKGWFGHI